MIINHHASSALTFLLFFAVAFGFFAWYLSNPKFDWAAHCEFPSSFALERAKRISLEFSSVCDYNSFDIIRNGTILSNGEVLKDNGQLVDISGGCCKKNHDSKLLFTFSLTEYVPGPLGVLLHSHDSTYFHALYEFAFRFQFVVEHCPRSSVIWLIRASSVQKRILALLDQPQNIRVSKFTAPRASAMILIPPAPPPVQKQNVAAFRAVCVSHALRLLRIQSLPFVLRRIVYVERLSRRVIINSHEVVRAFLQV